MRWALLCWVTDALLCPGEPKSLTRATVSPPSALVAALAALLWCEPSSLVRLYLILFPNDQIEPPVISWATLIRKKLTVTWKLPHLWSYCCLGVRLPGGPIKGLPPVAQPHSSMLSSAKSGLPMPSDRGKRRFRHELTVENKNRKKRKTEHDFVLSCLSLGEVHEADTKGSEAKQCT